MLTIITDYIDENRIALQIKDIGLYEAADTYYFAIDPSANNTHTIKSVIFLLDSWINCIKEIYNNKTVYLPFDFSDQYIGYLRIILLEDGKLNLTYGYSEEIEGWAINPSDLCASIKLLQFKPTSHATVTSYDILIYSILEERSKLTLML